MYRDTNPGNFRYLIGKTLDRISESTCDAHADLVHIDTEILFLYHLASPVTEGDTKFTEEWKDTGSLEHDVEKETKRTFNRRQRFEQLGALVRSLYRMGIIAKHETLFDEDADL